MPLFILVGVYFLYSMKSSPAAGGVGGSAVNIIPVGLSPNKNTFIIFLYAGI